jgi:fucose 4-O-acetylase-like acetyltransferase
MSVPYQRTAWIDILKGIAILFVVFGHNPFLLHLPHKVFNVIYSFHIPLFYFISGYLFKPNVSYKNLFNKRLQSLLKPYFFTCIAFSVVYILIKDKPSPVWYLFWILYGNGPNLPQAVFHLWFLPNLFLVTIIAWILFDGSELLKKSIVVQILFTAFLLIIGVLGVQLIWGVEIPLRMTNFIMHDGNQFIINGLFPNPICNKEGLLGDNPFTLYGLPWGIDIVLVSVALFLSGHVIRRNTLEEYFRKGMIATFATLLFITLHYYYNYTIDLNMRRYDNIVICTLLAYAAIYVCFYVSYNLSRINNWTLNVLNYIGKYSLIIFIFHPVIQSKVYHNAIPLLPDRLYFIAFICSLVAGICGPLLLNWLILERFKIFRFWYYAK